MQLIPACLLSMIAFSAGAFLMQDAKTERFTHALSKDADGGMARWMATCKAGPAHARLKELLGSYEMTMRMRMDPSKPPVETKGNAEVSWLVEGKWLQLKSSIQMFGRKVDSTTILGYDNFKERYVSAACDSLQTTLNTASGHFDQSGDNLILWGTIDEPMTPEQDKAVRYIYRGFGQDKWTFEVHDMMIGESDTKVLEFEYARKK
ncbi:MAG: DUF1579 family protein [Planctomycetes bacterium]|nr:DUF1579 family protein [Planctomycetota bacterium]